jgi:hypothetical protein
MKHPRMYKAVFTKLLRTEAWLSPDTLDFSHLGRGALKGKLGNGKLNNLKIKKYTFERKNLRGYHY